MFIYALEGYPEYTQAISELFDAIDTGQLKAFTSELAVAETLVKPLMDGNQELQDLYKSTLQDSDSLRVIPISRQILIKGAELRAINNVLRLPDAIHAATAIDNGCENLVSVSQIPGGPKLLFLLNR